MATKRGAWTDTHILLEILGVNANDVALFLETSRTAVVDYNRSTYKPKKHIEKRLFELTNLVTKAGLATMNRSFVATATEVQALRMLHSKVHRRIESLQWRMINILDHRAYAVRTNELILELEQLVKDRETSDPIARIVSIARARNNKRLFSYSLLKIARLHSNLKAMTAQVKCIEALLDRYDPEADKMRRYSTTSDIRRHVNKLLKEI